MRKNCIAPKGHLPKICDLADYNRIQNVKAKWAGCQYGKYAGWYTTLLWWVPTEYWRLRLALANAGVHASADQHDDQPRPCSGGTVCEQNYQHCACDDDIQQRHDGITRYAIGTLLAGTLQAQSNHARDRQNIKNQSRRDHVIE